MSKMTEALSTLMAIDRVVRQYVDEPNSERIFELPIKKEKQIVYCCNCGNVLDKDFTYLNNKKVCLRCKALYKGKKVKKEKEPYVKIVYRKKKEVK